MTTKPSQERQAGVQAESVSGGVRDASFRVPEIVIMEEVIWFGFDDPRNSVTRREVPIGKRVQDH